MGTITLSETVDSARAVIAAADERLPAPSLPVLLWRWFSGRLDKRRSRIALSELTDEQLRDIGLTRMEAETEVYRSFWD